MKLLIASLALSLSPLLGCSSTGKVDHLKENKDSDSLPVFLTSMPDPKKDLSERYYCKDGFTISNDFSTNEKQVVQRAFDAFNLHSYHPNLARFSDKETNCSLVKTDLSNNELGNTAVTIDGNNVSVVVAFDSNIRAIAGTEYKSEADIEEFYMVIVWHELQHVSRSAHLPDNVPGIMNPVISTIPVWTAADTKLCSDVWICPQ